MRLDSIVWEWPDRRGLEHLQLWTFADGIKADGLIVVDGEEGVIRLRYSMFFQSEGRLQRCGIFVPVGTTQKSLRLSLEPDGGWMVDGVPRQDLSGCVAFDITDTPFPKTPILEKLCLDENESKKIWVAYIDDRRLLVSSVEQEWGRFPSRLQGLQHFRCTSSSGVFEFDVDGDFLIHFCPQRWRIRSVPPRFIDPNEP
jgi:hypothetical protein